MQPGGNGYVYDWEEMIVKVLKGATDSSGNVTNITRLLFQEKPWIRLVSLEPNLKGGSYSNENGFRYEWENAWDKASFLDYRSITVAFAYTEKQGDKSPKEVYTAFSDGTGTAISNLEGGQPTSTPLVASSFDDTAIGFKVAATWLANHGTLDIDALVNQINEDASGFDGSASEAFTKALKYFSERADDLRTQLTVPGQTPAAYWDTLLTENGGAIRTYTSEMRAAWTNFTNNNESKPTYILEQVQLALKNYADQMDTNFDNWDSRAWDDSLLVDVTFANGVTRHFNLNTNEEWNNLDTWIRMTVFEKALTDLDTAGQNALTKLNESFNKTIMATTTQLFAIDVPDLDGDPDADPDKDPNKDPNKDHNPALDDILDKLGNKPPPTIGANPPPNLGANPPPVTGQNDLNDLFSNLGKNPNPTIGGGGNGPVIGSNLPGGPGSNLPVSRSPLGGNPMPVIGGGLGGLGGLGGPSGTGSVTGSNRPGVGVSTGAFDEHDLPDGTPIGATPVSMFPTSINPAGVNMSSGAGLPSLADVTGAHTGLTASGMAATVGASAMGGLTGDGQSGAIVGGAGYPGMYPPGGMGQMGGQGGQNEKERERKTWIAEDDEVWGTDPEAAPAVVGRDEFPDTVAADRAAATSGQRRPGTPYQPPRQTTRRGRA